MLLSSLELSRFKRDELSPPQSVHKIYLQLFLNSIFPLNILSDVRDKYITNRICYS